MATRQTIFSVPFKEVSIYMKMKKQANTFVMVVDYQKAPTISVRECYRFCKERKFCTVSDENSD